MKNEPRRSRRYTESIMIEPIRFMWRSIRYYLIYQLTFPRKNAQFFPADKKKAHFITFLALVAV